MEPDLSNAEKVRHGYPGYFTLKTLAIDFFGFGDPDDYLNVKKAERKPPYN
jgi:hypothetical protein